MAVSFSSSKDYFLKTIQPGDKVLLINPPVIDNRYPWIKWNQPLDLLKISTLLKLENKCEVRLYDFTQPKKSRVRRSNVTHQNNNQLNGDVFKLYYWGKPLSEFTQFLRQQISTWTPHHIIITSLTSYWWKGIQKVLHTIKTISPNTPCVIYGNYAIHESSHAENHVFPDIIITDHFERLSTLEGDFTLYRDNLPEFCALTPSNRKWDEEVIRCVNMGINKFIFFAERFLEDKRSDFVSKLQSIIKYFKSSPIYKQPMFYGICGIYANDIDKNLATLLVNSNFRQIYFEHNVKDDHPNVNTLNAAKNLLNSASKNSNTPLIDLGAFLMIGRPKDNIDTLIEDLFNMHEALGGIILKPFTPSPRTSIYSKIRSNSQNKKLELISPHFFPMNHLNHITLDEYRELYSLSSLLNYNVNGKGWDLFPGKLGFELLTETMNRQIWNLSNE